VPVRWPDKAATYRILVDGHTEEGRIGAFTGEVNCAAPPQSHPGVPAKAPEKKP